jgi:Uncharacterised protein family UPF0102
MPSDSGNHDSSATRTHRALPDRRGELGRRGEQLACTVLTEAGLQVVARNWRCRLGEIDVIAAGPCLLVFCQRLKPRTAELAAQATWRLAACGWLTAAQPATPRMAMLRAAFQSACPAKPHDRQQNLA